LSTDPDSSVIQLRALVTAGSKNLVPQGIKYDSMFYPAPVAHTDGYRETRVAMEKIGRAIKWINNPFELILTLVLGIRGLALPTFFGENPVIGVQVVNGINDIFFRLPVYFTDKIVPTLFDNRQLVQPIQVTHDDTSGSPRGFNANINNRVHLFFQGYYPQNHSFNRLYKAESLLITCQKAKLKELDYIRVVLIEPTHPGNIGAAARAMANMGVDQLVLVNPKEFPSPVANARAAGADRILENAQVFDNLDAAIADCTMVLGTTSRPRSIEWPSLDPENAMQQAASHAEHSRVAILFGRESRGLTNAELERCHYLVRIPVDDDFPSLNLGSAVMVMLYELRRIRLGSAAAHSSTPGEPVASAADMQHFYEHLQQVLELVEFCDGRSTKLQRKLVRLFNRAFPYEQEVKMLRGILSAIEDKVVHPGK
jgi:TrmH family RNA methyltransferase